MRFDTRSAVLRDAETLFEYMDFNGDGLITAREIQDAVDVLRPDLLDKRFLAKSSDLVAILIPDAFRAEPRQPISYNDFLIIHRKLKIPTSEGSVLFVIPSQI